MRLRFYLRTLFSLRSSAIWFEHLNNSASLRKCARHEPDMAEKLHRPYRRSGLSVQNRLDLVLDHIRIVRLLGWAELVASAYESTMNIAEFTDRNGNAMRLILARPGQFGKEGELAVHLVDGNTRLYSACISLREYNGIRELDVGCIQGPDHQNARQNVRDLTRNLHGLRPRSLILETLRSLAGAADCAGLRVVGNANHIYRSLRKRRTIAFDYDAFCAETGGVAESDGDWLLPVLTEPRQISEIPSKKRAEASRRRTLLEQIDSQIQANIQAAIKLENGRPKSASLPARPVSPHCLTAALHQA
jgi:hypothetical protein